MKPAVIKTEAQYRQGLARLEELVIGDPSPESDDGAELELLSLLVEDYEKKVFPFERPDPVEAIQFRMLEQDLRQVDLVPYFGSRSRVSEFLARQRPLTVTMVRELSAGLGIPAEVLVQDSLSSTRRTVKETDSELEWSKFPISEMASRGWIQLEKRRADVAIGVEAVRTFIEQALGGAQAGVLARRTIRGEAFSWPAIYALTAWQARVLQKAELPDYGPRGEFEFSKIDEVFFKELVTLSQFDDGPVKAVNYLRDAGIAVVIEEHLARTKLDGAAMLAGSGKPVIGLTLRFDRVDNFWFTLLHELVHVWKHLNNPGDVFLDRLADKESTEAIEKEADRYARDLLISRAQWKAAAVRQSPTRAGIVDFAAEQKVHPAIVAGRIQRDYENYTLFKDMVGQGTVRDLFLKKS
jgi:HTH-type transcriptional regulator/antitoxin HigA